MGYHYFRQPPHEVSLYKLSQLYILVGCHCAICFRVQHTVLQRKTGGWIITGYMMVYGLVNARGVSSLWTIDGEMHSHTETLPFWHGIYTLVICRSH